MVSQMLDCGYKLAYYAHRGRLDDDGLVAEACWPLGKCKCNVRWLSLPGEQQGLCLHKTKRWKMKTYCRAVSVVIDAGLPDINTYWHLKGRKSPQHLWNLNWREERVEKYLDKMPLHGSFLSPTGPSWRKEYDNCLEVLWVKKSCRSNLWKFRPPARRQYLWLKVPA